MNTSVKMVLTLSIITILSGGGLSGWEMYTRPMIEENRRIAIERAVKVVLPEAESTEKIQRGELTIHVGKKGDQIDGYAFLHEGSGFQGKIKVMVGIAPDFKNLKGMQVLEHAETPGLGDKIVADPSNPEQPKWFPEQFRGIETQPEITWVKNEKPDEPNEIQAITGATISSKAVVTIINKGVSLYQKAMKEDMPVEEESAQKGDGVPARDPAAVPLPSEQPEDVIRGGDN